MPATDLDLLSDAAREAGRIAVKYAGGSARAWEKPDDEGPVTEADLAVNAMLEDRLQSARPNYGWLSEETEDGTERLDRRCVFIIDPIDGTRSFADGSRTWAHSLAVARDGIITAAVIYLPQRELFFTAAEGHGARLNGETLRPSTVQLIENSRILAARPNMNSQHWRTGTAPSFERTYRPSLAYRLATVAQGRFDGMLTLRPSWEWDIAAGDLILREAGAVCTDRLGAPLRFNNPHPKLNGVIAANPVIHDQILNALVPVDPGPAK
ncbi:MAG: inositol monophosphatase family protein [Paracoccaceae bacterium]